MLFSVSFLIYSRIVYIWPMYHSFDERIYSTIIFSLSNRFALCSKFDVFHQCPMKGPIRKRFPVCLSVFLSISRFLHHGRLLQYFKTVRVLFSRKIHLSQNLGKNCPKWPQNRVFWIFWKILTLVFVGIKLELLLLLIFIHQSRIWFSSYGSKCCWPI